MPPNGVSGSAKPKLLIDTMPASMAAPIAVAVLVELEGVGRKTERQTVRLLRCIVELRERRDQCQRPKRLLAHGPRVLRHVGHNRRLEEVTLVADAASAGRNLCAFANRILNHFLDSCDTARIGERSHPGVLVEAVTDLDDFVLATNFSMN